MISTGTAGDPSSERIVVLYTAYDIFINFLKSLEWGSSVGFGLNSPSYLYTDTLEISVNILGVDIKPVKNVIGKDRLHLHNFFRHFLSLVS